VKVRPIGHGVEVVGAKLDAQLAAVRVLLAGLDLLQRSHGRTMKFVMLARNRFFHIHIFVCGYENRWKTVEILLLFGHTAVLSKFCQNRSQPGTTESQQRH